MVLLQREIRDLVGGGIGLGGDICDPNNSGDEAPGWILLCPWEVKSQLTPLPFQLGQQAQIRKKLPNFKRAESMPWH